MSANLCKRESSVPEGTLGGLGTALLFHRGETGSCTWYHTARFQLTAVIGLWELDSKVRMGGGGKVPKAGQEVFLQERCEKLPGIPGRVAPTQAFLLALAALSAKARWPPSIFAHAKASYVEHLGSWESARREAAPVLPLWWPKPYAVSTPGGEKPPTSSTSAPPCTIPGSIPPEAEQTNEVKLPAASLVCDG